MSRRGVALRRGLAGLVLLGGLLPACFASEPATRYYAGSAELEINGERIRFERRWACDLKTVFRPAQNDLFEKMYIRRTEPTGSFTAIRFGRGKVAVLQKWGGCASDRYSSGVWRQVTLFDNVERPTYGERLFLKVGEPPTIQNPIDRPFQVALISDARREVTEEEYQALVERPKDDGTEVLFQLVERAAYGLAVTAITWNDTGKTGKRSGLALTKDGWRGRDLPAPQASDQKFDPIRPPPNVSLLPLRLDSGPWGAVLPLPTPISIEIDGEVVDLDARGMGDPKRLPPGLNRVRVFAEVTTNVWASRCTLLPPPDCPKGLPRK